MNFVSLCLRMSRILIIIAPELLYLHLVQVYVLEQELFMNMIFM